MAPLETTNPPVSSSVSISMAAHQFLNIWSPPTLVTLSHLNHNHMARSRHTSEWYGNDVWRHNRSADAVGPRDYAALLGKPLLAAHIPLLAWAIGSELMCLECRSCRSQSTHVFPVLTVHFKMRLSFSLILGFQLWLQSGRATPSTALL